MFEFYIFCHIFTDSVTYGVADFWETFWTRCFPWKKFNTSYEIQVSASWKTAHFRQLRSFQARGSQVDVRNVIRLYWDQTQTKHCRWWTIAKRLLVSAHRWALLVLYANCWELKKQTIIWNTVQIDARLVFVSVSKLPAYVDP